MWFASQVPDGMLVAVFSIAASLIVGFAGWIAREMYRISELNGRTAERLDDLDRRIESMESLIPTKEH